MTDPDSPTVPDNAEPLNDSAPLAALRDLDEAGIELSLGEIALGQDGQLVRRGLECPITCNCPGSRWPSGWIGRTGRFCRFDGTECLGFD